MGKTPSENVFRIIQLVRILLRDAKYQQYLVSLDKVSLLAKVNMFVWFSCVRYVCSNEIDEWIDRQTDRQKMTVTD